MYGIYDAGRNWTIAAPGVGFDKVISVTIIVFDASAWMAPYHDRMPVMLAAQDFDAWFDGSLGPDALKRAAEAAFREWKMPPRMNRTGVGDDDPAIIEPLAVIHQGGMKS